MSWIELFAVLIVCHLVGDYLFQTDWQARNKPGGLGSDPIARRALISHTAMYMVAFIPALVWIGIEYDWLRAVLIGLVIAVPHLIQDDRRLLQAYIAKVKRSPDPPPELEIAVDQSFHILFLFATALLATA